MLHEHCAQQFSCLFFFLLSVWCIISSCFLIFLPAFYQQKHFFPNSEPSRRLCFTAVISFFLQQETIQYLGTETFCESRLRSDSFGGNQYKLKIDNEPYV